MKVENGHNLGYMSKSICHLPIISFIHVCLSQRICQLMRCENVLLFSALHLAVQHGLEQLVSDLLKLIQQLPTTKPPLVDSGNISRKVSDMWRLC